MTELFSYVILPVLTTVVTGVIGWLGVQIKKAIERGQMDKEKRQAAETCVRAVEQLYKDLHGDDKYNKCVAALTEMLNEKGIVITELEIKMLIEAAVHRMNENAEKASKKADNKPDGAEVV